LSDPVSSDLAGVRAQGTGLAAKERGWHVALIFIALLIIWMPPRFLTQDGPSHLYTSQTFYRVGLSQNSSECFRIVTPPPPNSLCTWLGAMLIRGVGATATEKIWATLYVLLIVGGALGVGACLPHNSRLGIYFLVLNPFLFAGFWNFNLAIGMFVISLAVICRARSAPSWYFPGGLLCLGILLYFTHLFVFAAFLLALYLALLAAALELWNENRLLFIVLMAVLLLAPIGGVLFLWRQLLTLGITAEQVGWGRIWMNMAGISPLSLNVWYRYGEQYVMLFIEAGLLVCFGYRAWRQRRFDFLLLVVALFLCFLLVPDQLGVTMAIKGRLWLAALLAAALWLPSAWNHAIGALCVILFLWNAFNILPRQMAWNRAVSQLEEVAPRLEKAQLQASLMGIYWGRSGFVPSVVPLLHVDLLLAESSDGVSLSSNQLHSGAFAVEYAGACRESADLLSALALREIVSTSEIADAIRRARVRYLVLWKTGALPWGPLMRTEQWRILHETDQFAVLDTGISQ